MGRRVKAPEGFQYSVRLLGQTWEIVYTNPKTADDDLGSSDGSNRRIEVSLRQSRGSMIDTLYHEIMHSYFRMMPGLSEYPVMPEDGNDAEEGLVVACTTAAIDLAANNAWVMHLLLGNK